MAFDLHQVAPGRYAGEFTPEVQGAYLVHIAGEGQGRVLATTRGWVLGYSAEYRPPVASPWVLEQLAVDHGGGLAPSRPGRVFRHSLATPPSAQPLWPWLLMLAASLLPADIAVRRLALDRADLLRAWSKVAGLWPQRREARPEERATDRRIEALMLAKRRARARGEVADQEAAGGDERMPIQEPEEVPDSAPQGGPVPESDGEPAEGSTAAKLLAKMKERRGEDPSELG